MAPKSISEEILKTDYGVNNQPILLQKCQQKRNEQGYDISNSFKLNDSFLGNGGPSKNHVTSLLCYMNPKYYITYVVLWIHVIDAICMPIQRPCLEAPSMHISIRNSGAYYLFNPVTALVSKSAENHSMATKILGPIFEPFFTLDGVCSSCLR